MILTGIIEIMVKILNHLKNVPTIWIIALGYDT